jgi:hypothetical protein
MMKFQQTSTKSQTNSINKILKNWYHMRPCLCCERSEANILFFPFPHAGEDKGEGAFLAITLT